MFFSLVFKGDLSYNECGRRVDLAGTNSLRGPTQFTQRGERRVSGWGGMGLDGVGRGWWGLGRVGRGWTGWDRVGQVTISPRELREACFGLELKADQIYRCDITITHRRDGNPSGALLSHSLFNVIFVSS